MPKTPTLSPSRKKEVQLQLAVYWFIESEIAMADLGRHLGSLAEELRNGITAEELMTFFEARMSEILCKTFGRESLGYTVSGQKKPGPLSGSVENTICDELVIHWYMHAKISLGNLRRTLGGISSKLRSVSADELMALVEDMMPEIIGRTFGYERVSITASDSN